MEWYAVLVIGAGVGFLAGLFGKGGAAIATPLLHAIGVPAIQAIATPLPATIPSTLAASLPYRASALLDHDVVRWSLVFGAPATVLGALATRWIGGGALVTATDVLVAGLGLRFLLRPGPPDEVVVPVEGRRLRLAAIAIAVGLTAGLLANSGGFLLAPLYMAGLRLPVKTAFACSLAVSAVLAVPGTLVHAALGHIDWGLVAVFGLASVPLSLAGARLAVRTRPERLERVYGGVLAALGVAFLVVGR